MKEAETLLNCCGAIQKMPSFGTEPRRKYLVAAKTCKAGMIVRVRRIQRSLHLYLPLLQVQQSM